MHKFVRILLAFPFLSICIGCSSSSPFQVDQSSFIDSGSKTISIVYDYQEKAEATSSADMCKCRRDEAAGKELDKACLTLKTYELLDQLIPLLKANGWRVSLVNRYGTITGKPAAPTYELYATTLSTGSRTLWFHRYKTNRHIDLSTRSPYAKILETQGTCGIREYARRFVAALNDITRAPHATKQHANAAEQSKTSSPCREYW